MACLGVIGAYASGGADYLIRMASVKGVTNPLIQEILAAW